MGIMKNENENGGQESINKSRRKLSKTGLVAPVLLSLTSKPSWAFVCTFSGAMSGNLSVEKAGFVCDSGIPATKSPGYYKTPSHWPSPSTCGLTPGTGLSNDGGSLFNTVFGKPYIKLNGTQSGLSLTDAQKSEPSILNVLLNNSKVVLKTTGKPPMFDGAAAFHFAAALISACADNSTTAGVQMIFPFTADQVKTAWTNQDRAFLSQLKLLQKSEYTVGQAAAIIKW